MRLTWPVIDGHAISLFGQRIVATLQLGQSLMARDFDRKVAEAQIRIAALDRYTALGMPVTEATG